MSSVSKTSLYYIAGDVNTIFPHWCNRDSISSIIQLLIGRCITVGGLTPPGVSLKHYKFVIKDGSHDLSYPLSNQGQRYT
jgi:hypothetical protein